MTGSVRPQPPSTMREANAGPVCLGVRAPPRGPVAVRRSVPPGKLRSRSIPRKTMAQVAFARGMVREEGWAEKWWLNLVIGGSGRETRTATYIGKTGGDSRWVTRVSISSKAAVDGARADTTWAWSHGVVVDTLPKRSYQRVRVVRRWRGHRAPEKCKSGDPTLTMG